VELLLSRTLPRGQCCLWAGAQDRHGYGLAKENGRMRLAHRLMLGLMLGRPIEPDDCVLHSCDVRACIAPAHLALGTVAENNNQRAARLSVNPRPKRVTAALLTRMRELRREGLTSAAIAEQMGVSLTTLRRHWRNASADGQLPLEVHCER
jgi:hypothetical protein